MGSLAAFGIRRLMDSNQNFFKAGLPIFYRTKNFTVENTLAGEMGLSVPSASGKVIDTQVCPQPGIRMASAKEIANAIEAGVTLRKDARVLTISHTFIQHQQRLKGFTNPRQVFNDDTVIGFYSEGLLFSIETYQHNEAYGSIIDWTILANANEIR